MTGGVVRRRGGIVEDGLVVAADIAGEDHYGFFAIFGNGEDETGGAENVAGVVGVNVKFGADVKAAAAGHRFHGAQGGIDVLRGVQRLRVCMVAVALCLGVQGIFFLQVRGVFEQELC